MIWITEVCLFLLHFIISLFINSRNFFQSLFVSFSLGIIHHYIVEEKWNLKISKSPIRIQCHTSDRDRLFLSNKMYNLCVGIAAFAATLIQHSDSLIPLYAL